MSTRRVSYCLIVCVSVLYSTSVTASFYADYSRRPLSEMLEAYSRFEANLQAGSNYNVGAAAALMVSIGKKGGREALPFLEKKSLMANIPSTVRSRAAEVYVSLATAEECAAFLPEILKVGNQTVWTAGWRSGVLPACLRKIDDAIAQGEISDKTLNLLVEKLLAHTQSLSVPRLADGDMIDRFLIRHCAGYATSRQRLAMWTEYLDELGNEAWENDLRKKFTPNKEFLEALPPKQRIDLRKRFPDLPPLPEEVSAGDGGRMKAMIASVVGFAALAACAAAVWLVFRRRRSHGAG